jgi:hypothetical protein
MPCVQGVIKQRYCRPARNRSEIPIPYSQYDDALLKQIPEEGSPPPHAVIDVGTSVFIIKSGDRILIEELRLFSESLTGSPRAEVRFTNKLFFCTEEGRLRPWGWQRLPNRTG